MSWNTAKYLLQGNFLSIAKLKISLLKYLTHRRFRLYHVKASLNFLRIDSAKHHIAILERLKRADQTILSLLPFAVLYRISGCIICYHERCVLQIFNNCYGIVRLRRNFSFLVHCTSPRSVLARMSIEL